MSNKNLLVSFTPQIYKYFYKHQFAKTKVINNNISISEQLRTFTENYYMKKHTWISLRIKSKLLNLLYARNQFRSFFKCGFLGSVTEFKIKNN